MITERDGVWRFPEQNENSEGSHLPDPDLTGDGTPLAEMGNSGDRPPQPIAESPVTQSGPLCAHCGRPGTEADPVRHGYWRANHPTGNWIHAGCLHAYQAGAPWR